LLKEAKARITTLGVGDWQAEETKEFDEEISEEEVCPIRDIALDWLQGTTPRLKIFLDRDVIENEVHSTDEGELDFEVDGRRLTRWFRQSDGSWAGNDHIYAEPDKQRENPNLSPRTFRVLFGSGESLLEWDFSDSGLSMEVLLFDLDRGKTVNTGMERLDPNRRYAIICDRNCELQGCDPVETFERNGISKKVIRFASPLNRNLCISYRDFILWQPVHTESDKHPHPNITLKTHGTKVLSLQDRSKLILEGLPEDAESVALLIHTKILKVQKEDGRWITSKEVTITPELAARQRRVRVRFISGERSTTIVPRLEFSLLGVAMLRSKRSQDGESMSFEVLNQDEELNRSEVTTHLSIWTPKQDMNALVLENNYRVGKVRHRKIKLKSIPGHGGELNVINNGDVFEFGVTCLDTGCISSYTPSLLGCDAQLKFTSDKSVTENGYVIYICMLVKIESQNLIYYRMNAYNLTLLIGSGK